MTVVVEFHEAFSLPAPDVPPVRPDSELVRLRMRLIREEFDEVMAELKALLAVKDADSTIEVYRLLLKELCDLRYVTEGAAVVFGLPIDDAYAEVHRSNMSKLGPDGRPMHREDGKVLKGPNYFQANMDKFVPSIINHEEDNANRDS